MSNVWQNITWMHAVPMDLLKHRPPSFCCLSAAASLLSMLSGARPAAGKGGSGGGSSTAAAAAAGSSSSRHMTGCDLEHLQQLHVFFNSLVDDMSANVQRLALRGFNSWLVGVKRGEGRRAGEQGREGDGMNRTEGVAREGEERGEGRGEGAG